MANIVGKFYLFIYFLCLSCHGGALLDSYDTVVKMTLLICDLGWMSIGFCDLWDQSSMQEVLFKKMLLNKLFNYITICAGVDGS